jgi:hypothetical protein
MYGNFTEQRHAIRFAFVREFVSRTRRVRERQ